MLELTIFAIISAGIICLSYKSLRKPRSHGFFRFFAFEFILILVLLNAKYWFREPFSALQISSWLLLVLSLAMAVHGFFLLRVIGKPGTAGIEDTTILVRRGIYKYIRHPLYGSLLLFGWGAFLKDPSVFSAITVLGVSAFLVATARIEESENLQKFGTEYANYVKTTKMFIPFVF